MIRLPPATLALLLLLPATAAFAQEDPLFVPVPVEVDDDAPPPTTWIPTGTPEPRVQRELQVRTEEFQAAKHQAVAFGVVGVASIVGAVAVLVTARDTAEMDSRIPWFLALYGGGIAMECVSGAKIAVAIVRGVRLRAYEHKVGWRIAFAPVVRPDRRAGGLVARLEF